MPDRQPWTYRGIEIEPFYPPAARPWWMYRLPSGRKVKSPTKRDVRMWIDSVLGTANVAGGSDE